MNNTDKQQYFIELDDLINELIKKHNQSENFKIMSNEIELIVNSVIDNNAKEKILSYKEKSKIYDEMFNKSVDILVHAGFEYKK